MKPSLKLAKYLMRSSTIRWFLAVQSVVSLCVWAGCFYLCYWVCQCACCRVCICVSMTTNHKLKNLSQGVICICNTITAPVYVWVIVGVVNRKCNLLVSVLKWQGHFQATDSGLCEYFCTWCLRALKKLIGMWILQYSKYVSVCFLCSSHLNT